MGPRDCDCRMGWKNQNFPQLWIAYQAQIDSSDLPGLANEVDSSLLL
jgi:hypothetical protein